MKQRLEEFQTRTHLALQAQLKKLAEADSAQESFIEAIEYATLNQGKRLRPALLYAVADALQIPLEDVDSSACAIELIHSYSLVHDDLPAMDDDDLRRGQPTTHIKYGEANAILVGDAQQTLAFQILSEDNRLAADKTVELIRLLTQASGANGMIAGQVMDIASEGKLIPLQQLQQLHQLKTGALIKTSLLMGAVQSPRYPSLQNQLAKLGETIGLAFQVQDDILDIESDTETLGKPQGSDLALDKSTYPKLMGLEQAKHYRDELITEAKQLLHEMELRSDFLFEIIDYIAERKH